MGFLLGFGGLWWFQREHLLGCVGGVLGFFGGFWGQVLLVGFGVRFGVVLLRFGVFWGFSWGFFGGLQWVFGGVLRWVSVENFGGFRVRFAGGFWGLLGLGLLAWGSGFQGLSVGFSGVFAWLLSGFRFAGGFEWVLGVLVGFGAHLLAGFGGRFS